MIEIIQQTEKTEENIESRLPKNIRQIGNPEKDFRIYMEDYVYTYLHPAQIPGMEMGVFPRLLILLGEINHFSDRSCAFISGAIQVENGVLSEEVPELNDKTWRQIYKEIRQYFEKCEIVGWVLDIPGNTIEITEEMEEMHRKNFVSQYQFFFLMDSKEREEAFYSWKGGRLSRKDGYFIYYEKNPQMQEYMIHKREAIFGAKLPAEEVEDQVTKNYRAMMVEKKEHKYKHRSGFLSYVTSLLMVVVLCSVSVILLGYVRRMENVEQTISVMAAATESPDKQVLVENISSNVKPLQEEVQERKEQQAESLEAENSQKTEAADDTEEKTDEGGALQEADVQAEEASVSEAEICRAQGYYIVQPGDSLEEICYKIYETYAVLDALCEKNAIEDQDTIYAGQKIILP